MTRIQVPNKKHAAKPLLYFGIDDGLTVIGDSSPSVTQKRRRRREEREWAARNGPLVVRKLGEES